MITKIIINLLTLFLFTIAPIPFNNIKFIKPKGIPPKENYITVRVTMYTIDPKQTDETPLETASGFIVDSINPKKHRIIAVSHDLKKNLKWGEKVKVIGIGKYSGYYYVKDLMNKRHKKMIDILINPNENAETFNSAKLIKL